MKNRRAELKRLARTISASDWAFLAHEHATWDRKRLGIVPPASGREYRALRAELKAEATACGDCAARYPLADLMLDSELYCRKCRDQ